MIERATREQVPALRMLWESVFGEDPAFLDLFFARVFVPDNTLVWMENGRVVSALYVLPYLIAHGEENLRASYLYALATEPAWRGRKIMSRLIEASFDLCAARGYALSMLVPAKDSLFGFYRGFGFEEFFDRVRVEKTRAELQALAVGCEPVKLVTASAELIWRQYRASPFCRDGCVVLTNQDLDAVAKNLQVGLTPVIISSSVEWLSLDDWNKERNELNKTIENWRADWESRDTERYLKHYSRRFKAGGQSFDQFAAQKRQVNAGKEWIKLKINNLSVFRNPGKEDVVVVTFDQDYRSNNLENQMKKRQYWQREDGKWKIIYEGSA